MKLEGNASYNFSERLKPAIAALKGQEKPIPFGGQWVIRGQHQTSLLWPVAALVFGVAAALLLIAVLKLPYVTGENGPSLLLLIACGFLLYGATALKKTLGRRKLGTPLLMLSQESYLLGQTVELSFLREGKKNLPTGTLLVTVLCEEVTLSGDEDSGKRDHRVLFEQVSPVQQATNGQELKASLKFQIPPELPGNRYLGVDGERHVLWVVIVRQSVQKWTEESYYLLDVRDSEKAPSLFA